MGMGKTKNSHIIGAFALGILVGLLSVRQVRTSYISDCNHSHFFRAIEERDSVIIYYHDHVNRMAEIGNKMAEKRPYMWDIKKFQKTPQLRKRETFASSD